MPPGEHALLRLQHWEVSAGCVCHDVRNGVRLGLRRSFPQEDTVKSAYIVVESLRNSYFQLVGIGATPSSMSSGPAWASTQSSWTCSWTCSSASSRASFV
eukprot:15446785-Alexandrium_andersonii.AAC.1